MERRKILRELEEIKKSIQVSKIEKLDDSNNHFLHIEKYNIVLNNQDAFVREKLIKTSKGKKINGSAAIIVPITKDNKSIVIVQPRVFKEDPIAIEVPAGYIDENESAICAARRELIEETGYIAEELIELKSFYQDSGIGGAKNTCFLALGCEKKGEQNLDCDEYIKYLECTFDDLVYLVDNNYINDVNGIIAINEAKKYLKYRK